MSLYTYTNSYKPKKLKKDISRPDVPGLRPYREAETKIEKFVIINNP